MRKSDTSAFQNEYVPLLDCFVPRNDPLFASENNFGGDAKSCVSTNVSYCVFRTFIQAYFEPLFLDHVAFAVQLALEVEGGGLCGDVFDCDCGNGLTIEDEIAVVVAEVDATGFRAAL